MKIKNLFILLVTLFCVSISTQDLYAAEVQYFDIEKYLSKVGNIDISSRKSSSEMENVAQQHLFRGIREHLKKQNLENQLHSIEVNKSDIVSVATPQVNKEIEQYLNDLVPERTFSVQIQGIQSIPLEKVQHWLKGDKDWQFPNIHIVIDSITQNQAQQELEVCNKIAKVLHSPTITISNNYINKLQMTSKENLNYITGYNYINLPNQEKLTVPQVTKLEQKFDLYMLPVPEENNKNILYLYTAIADYEKPIKIVKTKDGIIHHPQLYHSSSFIKLLFTTPTTMRIVVGPNQKQEVHILYLLFNSVSNEVTHLLQGKVIAKIERKFTEYQKDSELPGLAEHYVLETGKSSYLREKLKVSLHEKNTHKKIATGKIIQIQDHTCIGEFSEAINTPIVDLYYSLYEEK